MATSYNLRKGSRDYKELASQSLPRAERVRYDRDKLYDVEIVEKDGERVKIHFIGYSSKHDEWTDAVNVVNRRPVPSYGVLQVESYRPFDMHKELLYQIKLALNSGTRHDVEVRIEISFDPLVFAGGLQQCGTFLRTQRGHRIYGIKTYSDLVPLLGSKWHLRGLNDHDFCYVNLVTVQYHLHQRQDITDHQLDGSCLTVQGGFVLVFKFVRMDGTSSQWDSVANM